MKPLHSSLTRLSRCPCCHSRYSCSIVVRRSNIGKSAARRKAKNEMKREINA